jgi:hypothetical protein
LISVLSNDCEIAFHSQCRAARFAGLARTEEWGPLRPCGVQAIRSSNNCRSGLGIPQNLLARKIAVNRPSRKIDSSQRSTRACARLFGASGILKVRPNRENPQLELKGVSRERRKIGKKLELRVQASWGAACCAPTGFQGKLNCGYLREAGSERFLGVFLFR